MHTFASLPAPAFEFPWERSARLSGQQLPTPFVRHEAPSNSLPERLQYTLNTKIDKGAECDYGTACSAASKQHRSFVGTSLHRCVARWVLREVWWGWRRWNASLRMQEEADALRIALRPRG